MGLLDKLKAVAKSAIDEKTNNGKAVFLDNIIADGSIKGDALPAVKGLAYFSINTEEQSIIVYESVAGSLKTKNKLITKIPLSEIVMFKALKKERKDFSSFTMFTYESEISCALGDKYILHQGWNQRFEETSYSIKDEMNGVISLNTVLMLFVSKITDNATKQWVNEIYAERETEPVFDEEGNVDLDKFLTMHNEWFASKKAEWENRLKSVL